MKKTATEKIAVCAALCAAMAASATTITGVTANQRWPWNGLMDVDFNVSGSESSMAYRIELSATYNGGANKVYASSYLTEPVVEGDGPKRVTWNLDADCPNLKADDFTVTVAATPLVGGEIPVYMVIDLSSGVNSTKYPVRYTTVGPDLNSDVCRTTEMWLRRIRTGVAFPMGGSDAMTYLTPTKAITLTKDFYMAIFETTQQQWAQVMGTWPSTFSNETCRATRPVESIDRSMVRGSFYYWPSSAANSGTFVNKVRARTGLIAFDLPTEAQWEYAARGGASAAASEYTQKRGCYSVLGGDVTDALVPQIARCNSNGGTAASGDVAPSETEASGTMTVGHYKPNDYGLYDMLGNVWEMVIDRWAANWPEEMDTTDYKGPTSGGLKSVAKGRSYGSGAWYYSVRARSCVEDDNLEKKSVLGARFCVTLD